MTARVSKIVTNDQINRIAQIESAGNPKAKAPTSTAFGLGQFIKSTWLEELKQHRPDLFNGPPYDDEMALGKDPALQLEMLVYFTEDNAKALGRGFQDGDLYLAHFSGIGVAKKLLRADPNDPVTHYYDKGAIKANKTILLNKNGSPKSVGGVRVWAQNSMINRWNRAGKPDWIAKYWKGRHDNQTTDDDEVDIVPTPRPRPKEADEDNEKELSTVRPITGNAAVLDIQKRLKAMKYNPGGLDGLWGGMTAGALTGFLTDRNMRIPAPTSIDTLAPVLDAIKDELAEAESEGFTRPVSDARANADQKKVEDVAPDVVPVKRNFLTAVWGAVVAFFTAAWDTITSTFGTLFGFVTDHKDDVPEEAKSGLFSILSDIPPVVWLVAIGGLFAFIGYNSWSSIKKTTEQVKSGERL